MEKIKFMYDYQEGCHEAILEKLVETNLVQTCGYGEDGYCEKARTLIKEACGIDDLDVHFLVGGTQTNAVFLKHVLKPYQGVICATTGHINCHETGAIEAGGHKCLAFPVENDGKLTASQVEKAHLDHVNDVTHEHIVQPAVVYISQATESGALYSLKELTTLSETCHKYGLLLYVDGARMGYALASPYNDVTLNDLASLTDAFYIGGTKCGALFGEALVIVNKEIRKDFRYSIKQGGAMLAKGRLLGIQFMTLFENGRYIEICKKPVLQALYIAKKLKENGYKLFADSPTNQQFVIIPNKKLAELEQKYELCPWCKIDEENSVFRICTSWATKDENVEALLADMIN